jgi:hypothetical protein
MPCHDNCLFQTGQKLVDLGLNLAVLPAIMRKARNKILPPAPEKF